MNLKAIISALSIFLCLWNGKAQTIEWGGQEEERKLLALSDHLFLDIRSVADGKGSPVRLAMVRSDSSKGGTFHIDPQSYPHALPGQTQVLFYGKGMPGWENLQLEDDRIEAEMRIRTPMTTSDSVFVLGWNFEDGEAILDTGWFFLTNEKPWDGIHPYPFEDTLERGWMTFYSNISSFLHLSDKGSRYPYSALKEKGLNRTGDNMEQYVSFYEDAGIKTKGEIRSGTRTGTWFSFHTSGRRKGSLNYIQDKAYGDYEMKGPEGKIWFKGSYRDGKKVGLWQETLECMLDSASLCTFTLDYGYEPTENPRLVKATDPSGKQIMKTGKGKIIVLAETGSGRYWQKQKFKKGYCIRRKTLREAENWRSELEILLY